MSLSLLLSNNYYNTMIIIANFINCIIKFTNSGNILTVPVRGCSNCGYLGCLHRHGCYQRNLITFTGCFRISIQRYKCPSCGKTCSVRPFFVLPYFQYSFFVVFSILLQSFVFKYSYSRIVSCFLALNPSGLVSISHISFYHKRFILCHPIVKVFLMSSSVFSHYSTIDICELSCSLRSIFDLISSGNNFLLDFYSSVHRYFMQKP